MMVVLLLVGLASSMVLLNLPSGGARLADEAEHLAAQEAVLTNRPVEIILAANDSSFRVQRRGRWVPLVAGPFKPRPWGEGLSVALTGGAGRRAVRFDSSGSTDPATIRMTASGRSIDLIINRQGRVQIHDLV
jgi:general secretion pathway protein H